MLHRPTLTILLTLLGTASALAQDRYAKWYAMYMGGAVP